MSRLCYCNWGISVLQTGTSIYRWPGTVWLRRQPWAELARISPSSATSEQIFQGLRTVLFWFGIFTLQYTLFSIIFCKPWSILAPILRVISAIPAASSKSEQVFSVAGRVVTLDWNRLAPEMVEVQSATAEKHALCVKNLLALRLIWLLLFNIYVLILSSQL